MKKKNVVHILESMGAGTLTSVSQICNYLVAQGVSVHLIYSPLREETPDNWKDFFDEKVIAHRVDMKRQLAPLSDLRSAKKLAQVISRLSPDILHAHSSKAGALARIAVAFSSAKPSVYYSPRGFSFLQLNYNRFIRRIYFYSEKLLAATGGTIVACSQSELEQAKKVSSKSVLIENAIDHTKLILKDSTNREDAPIRVGTLGRIGRQKNPLLFAEIARVVQTKLGRQVEFVWIGGGEKSGKEVLVKAGVAVTGWVSRPTALSELSGLDIYLQTSSWEGMPLSVIEAQMIGLPAVVTNVIGNKDVVRDHVTGFICDDTDSLASCIGQLVEDEILRVDMGAAARDIGLERFSVERMGKEYMDLYGLDQLNSGAIDQQSLYQLS